MSMMQIRGQQIKDHQIKDQHIDGKLSEAVLDIKFSEHAAEILEEKKVVDYVQRNGVDIAVGVDSITFVSTTPHAADDEAKGIVVNKYEVRLRDTLTGEPVVLTLDGEKAPMFGDIEFVETNGADHTYRVTFKAKKADGSVVPATVPATTKIDILYPQRFSLQDVSETFASNERFVDAAADTTAHLNIKQLAKELFGTGYVINNTGDVSNPFGNGNTVQQQLHQETHGVTNPLVNAKDTIDEVITARAGKDSLNKRITDIEVDLDNQIDKVYSDLLSEAAGKGAALVHVEKDSTIYTGLGLTQGNASLQKALDDLYTKVVTDDIKIKTDLASTDAGKGSSTVGVEDAAGVFTGTTVETVLKELYDKIVADGETERNARIAADTALSNRVTATEDEISQARGSMATVKERLDVSLMADGQLKEYTVFHKHSAKHIVLSENLSLFQFNFAGTDQFTKPKATDHYEFLINGMDQMSGTHFTVSVDEVNYTVTVEMSGGSTAWAGDVVTLKSVIYAVPQK